MTAERGRHMAAEIVEAPQVFGRAALAPIPASLDTTLPRAIYTIARGSSDAAANILSYEFMRETGRPVTSLPPSIFSIGAGVALDDAMALIVSQSGASEDLVRAAHGAGEAGARVIAITNQPGSPVEAAASATIPIGAGPENAVPATKTVVGSVAAGLALLAALVPAYAPRLKASAATVARMGGQPHPGAGDLKAALAEARHVYVIGRDTGYGAAHEIALKIKETCAIHAEAYSASEVLHGPLQLATRRLTVVILDTGQPHIQDSLDTAEARLRDAGARVIRVGTAEVTSDPLTPGAAAALLLCQFYPVIREVAIALGADPDAPATLKKVTQTR